MIKVTIELHSANTKEISTLGEILISNDGTGTEHQGNYNIVFYKKDSKIWRREKLFSFPRKRLNVFYLLQRALMKL